MAKKVTQGIGGAAALYKPSKRTKSRRTLPNGYQPRKKSGR